MIPNSSHFEPVVILAASVLNFSNPVQLRVRTVTFCVCALVRANVPLPGVCSINSYNAMLEHVYHRHRPGYGEIFVLFMCCTSPTFLVILTLRTYALYDCSKLVLFSLLGLIVVRIPSTAFRCCGWLICSGFSRVGCLINSYRWNTSTSTVRVWYSIEAHILNARLATTQPYLIKCRLRTPGA